jgi:hypothetical protein
MTARAVVIHHLRSAAGMRDVWGCHLFHHGTHFGAGIGGNPNARCWARGSGPILLIPIVAAWILAINGRLRSAIRPNQRDAMSGFDPAAQACYV